jgi:ribonuclease HI
MNNYKIYSDGASRGNPGMASAGGVIYSPTGEIVHELSKSLGIATNNVAEYLALKLILERAVEMGIRNVEVFMDSKLVVEQMNGRWKINNQFLKMIFDEIQNLKLNFDYITFTHIYRDLNKTADKLANLSFT